MTYLLRIFGGILLSTLFLIGVYYLDPAYLVLILKVIGFLFLIMLILTFIVFLYASQYKPEHGIRIHFPDIPPNLSWINTPRKGASKEERTIKLANGEVYEIPEDAKGEFILLAKWEVECDLKKEGAEKKVFKLIIPPSFRTDLASIPWFIRAFITPLNNSVYAAILHDYIYRNQVDSEGITIAKKTADQFFYMGLKAKGIKPTIAAVMYFGVLLFGHSSYAVKEQ